MRLSCFDRPSENWIEDSNSVVLETGLVDFGAHNADKAKSALTRLVSASRASFREHDLAAAIVDIAKTSLQTV